MISHAFHPARTAALAVAALSTVSVLAACGGSGSSGAAGSKAPIVIGASLSLSGDFAADGQAFQRGYQLWANNVNSHGGLLGRKVKLDIISDASSPAQVVTNYQKLISVDHVDLVFGPFSTTLTVPSSKIAARYGKAFIEGAGGGPSAFANGLTNIFDVSLPIKDELIPFVNWVKSLPASGRPATAAFPTSDDPFTQPQIQVAQQMLTQSGIKAAYAKVFPSEVTDFKPIADNVASSAAQMVVLGSVDVPTVSSFIQAFAQSHYNPKIFLASGGPDQGAAFVHAVGAGNTDGVMVPNGWYPGYQNAQSQAMVKSYIATYGGSPSDVNSDVAEAYSVGQVAAQAVTATHGTDNSKIISYLHSGVTLQSVQGPVKFDSSGQNGQAASFIFQWQHGKFVQVLPVGSPGAVPIENPKAAWGG
jgi:branched-chain amino acid transport system substrate-binding protein